MESIDSLHHLTPGHLHEIIVKSPLGFSVENDCIQYLGRDIKLSQEKSFVHDMPQPDNIVRIMCRSMLARLISLQPDLKKQLPQKKSEAIQKAAFERVKKYGINTVINAPTDNLKYASALEYIAEDYSRIHKDEIKEILHPFDKNKRFQFLSTVQKITGNRIPVCIGEALLSNPGDIFKLIKDSYQNPDSVPFEYGRNQLLNDVFIFSSSCRKSPFKSRFDQTLELLNKLINGEDNKLVKKLIPEINRINETFSDLLTPDRELSTENSEAFEGWANKVLYLVAACSGVSPEVDIDAMVPYITSIMGNNDHRDIEQLARELAFLLTPSNTVDYSPYIDVTGRMLRNPESLAQHGKYRQISNFRKFRLLEADQPLKHYLTAIKKLVKTAPLEKYSNVLLAEIIKIQRAYISLRKPGGSSWPAPQRQAIRKSLHRLLLVIAACKNSPNTLDPARLTHTLSAENLALFVQAIMRHKNINNIPYLVSGLACLVQSPPEVQRLLCPSDSKGGDLPLLAPLSLVRLFTAEKLSTEDMSRVCGYLQVTTAARRKIKNAPTFQQWLVTLDRMQACPALDKTKTGQLLQKVTINMKGINEKLGLLNLMFSDNENDFSELMDMEQGLIKNPLFTTPETETEDISENNSEINKSVAACKWLLQQRHALLLPVYRQKIMTADFDCEKEKTDLINLIDQFPRVSASGTFVEDRQSSEHNPHLEAVYQTHPKLVAGWNANVKGFSQEIRSKLKAGRTLELTEDPWDLFISGTELGGICQAPDSDGDYNHALMGYVMDGRNAMIVIKNSSKNIICRAVIRIVLDQIKKPALFIERVYDTTATDKEPLLMAAAQEIAHQMELSLYQTCEACEKDQAEELKMLAGRAPFDYFDSAGGLKKGNAEVIIRGHKVQ